ncbi:beta-ketoacyl-[acyl-carrier-protein] synthase family protein [Tengunoibacter tsumagoiensis]|uniref:3-oxoacyl-[acyl-carrier-protein] synthase 2 n=1 Tax=Tengunoibacter tsumagoiensis TaxID=2014871 RepID=A0A402A7U0_9CHLR|nr:beta-ketoacyl-[acyl-carrier-protein] synthase family protein [Tengunoibacter tsumagoiensis]GCE15213.1 3-oxoacyl-[acyl-carrier-protein] synthase 2 [Tengunoibacter tsumagoiensis]
MSTRRVVITGMGAVTPLGNCVESFWHHLCAGHCGIEKITHFDATPYQVQIAAEVRQLELPSAIEATQLKRFARFALLGLIAALEAWQHAGLERGTLDPYQIGVLVGSSHGGEESLIEGLAHILANEPGKVSPRLIPRMLSNMAAMQIARQFDLHGPSYGLNTACATGAQAIGEAAEMIKRGDAVAMLCGGTEACITPLTLVGDQAARALSTRNGEPQKACRPFDLHRDGFVLGEGAGILVLEDYEHALARGASIYAELSGYSTTIDASHETRPDLSGTHLAQAMKRAMSKSDVSAREVDAIFAHATGTVQGDRAEAMALTHAFGQALPAIPVVAIKAAVGHTLGASGAIQAIAAIQSLRTQTLPPTLNSEQADPACGSLKILAEACPYPLHTIISNAAGFGGHNVSLVLTSPS